MIGVDFENVGERNITIIENNYQVESKATVIAGTSLKMGGDGNE